MAVNLFRQGTNTIKNSTFTTDLDAVGGKTISRTDDGTEVDVSFDLRLEMPKPPVKEPVKKKGPDAKGPSLSTNNNLIKNFNY